MASSEKKDIEQYQHKGKDRVNNPPVGLVTPETDKDEGKKTYQYDPHLDPQLVWAGKAEHTSFEVPTVSLHVHERIDPRTIIEAARKRGVKVEKQLSLFEFDEERLPNREAIEFYKHKHNSPVSVATPPLSRTSTSAYMIAAGKIPRRSSSTTTTVSLHGSRTTTSDSRSSTRSTVSSINIARTSSSN